MPKHSGLFGFIDLAIEEKTIGSLPMGTYFEQASNEKNYHLLFNKTVDTLPNPYNENGYVLGRNFHLRIDRDYHGSQSVFLHRRNLSYCHATEYFINAAEKITVHYYFDSWGRNTHSRVTDTNGWLIPVSYAQNIILENRAAVYGQAISELLTKKQQRFCELSIELEKLRDDIMQQFIQDGYNRGHLLAKIRKQATLNAKKNMLDDSRLIKKYDMFIHLLHNLELKNIESKAQVSMVTKNESSLTAGVKAEETEEPAVSPKTKMNKKQVSLAESKRIFKEKLSALKANIKNLLSICKEINAKSTQEQLKDYVVAYISLRLDLLSFKFNNELSESPEIFEMFEHLLDEKDLFKIAVSELNVLHVETLAPYCTQAITNKLCSKLMDDWLRASALDLAKAAKMEQIFDLFNESTEAFSAFVRIRSMSLSRPSEKSEFGCSLLALAYLSGRKETFSALLRYGADAQTYWSIDKDGAIISAFEAMLRNNCDEDFYVDILVEYGAKIKNDCNVATTYHNLESLDNIVPSSKLRALKREFKPLIDNMNGLFSTDKEFDKKIHIIELMTFCPLYNFTYGAQENKNILYAAFAKHSGLASLLLSMAYFYSIDGFSLTVLSNSTRGGVAHGSHDIEDYDEIFGLDDPANPSYLYLHIGIEERAVPDKVIKFKILVDIIKERFPENIDENHLNNALSEIKNCIIRFESFKNSKAIACAHIAMNIAYALSGQLSELQTTICIKNWYATAESYLKHVAEIKNIAKITYKEELLSGKNTNELLRDLKRLSQSLYSDACAFFNNTMQMGYCSAYASTRNLPDVIDASAKLTEILNSGKLSPGSRARFMVHSRSLAQWADIVAPLKPWLNVAAAEEEEHQPLGGLRKLSYS